MKNRTRQSRRRSPGFGLLTVCCAACFAQADEPVVDEVTVTAERRPVAVLELAGNAAGLSAAELVDGGHQHIHEALTRVPATWISRGSAQESLVAIRSPVLTGAGSCGAFLVLEDGVPIRPSGFCNVNQLFELYSEGAVRLEVVRGPGTALYGSNALHGIVNAIMPRGERRYASLEAGENAFRRLQLATSGRHGFVQGLYARDGGFRDDSGYRQAKVHASGRFDITGGDLELRFTATDLAQETAGFIVGENAYRDPAVRTSNPNPEAFRDADSQRLSGLWRSADSGFELRPYLRRSDMRFLQHFLPGQPLEENHHVSAGVIASLPLQRGRLRWTLGADLEWAAVTLREYQDGPTEGSDFLRETRPAGRHYDFEVTSLGLAPWLQAEFAVDDTLAISAGLRSEYLYYDYDNRMLNGNTRDDGTNCGFGGCLYTRPADRSDGFFNLAPKLGLVWRRGERHAIYLNLARGFRAPQMTELYRLQSGQQVADLDSERADVVELGYRHAGESLDGDVAVFWMTKRGSVLRDAAGFNVDDGRSRHEGIETRIGWRPQRSLRIAGHATYARHRYDFNRVAQRGETFVAGNDVDTAPRWLAGAELGYDFNTALSTTLQWTLVGPYYLDAENRFRYPGHELLHLRSSLRLGERLRLVARLNNVADKRVADRADYAFGNFRYFPARGRELFVELRYE